MKNNIDGFNLDDIKKGGKKPTLDQLEGNLGEDDVEEEKIIIEEGKGVVRKSKINKDIEDIENSYK